jgi:tetratricopeptide (TPR) repeat protein
MMIQQFVKVGFNSLAISLMLGAPIAQSAQAITVAQAKPSDSSIKSDDKSAQALQVLEAASYLKRSMSLVEKFPDEALSDMQKALALFRSAKKSDGEAMSLLMIGRIHLNLKQNQAAINSMKQALFIFQELKDRSAEGMTLMFLGVAHLQLAEIQNSLPYLKQAEQAFRDTKDTDGLKVVQNLIQLLSIL